MRYMNHSYKWGGGGGLMSPGENGHIKEMVGGYILHTIYTTSRI